VIHRLVLFPTEQGKSPIDCAHALNLVVGGWSSNWGTDVSSPTQVNATLLSAAGKLSAIQPIQLAPLPPLHVAVPH
jgi:hypothetical protein